MADRKPRGREVNQGVKLIIIRDYLYSHSDKTHYVTSKDIIEHLDARGIHADRRTIFSDMNRLQNDLGIPIEVKKHYGYRVLEPKFEPNELRLMVDSVQSAKFITEADTLKRKIKDLATVHTAPQLERTAYVSRRARTQKENITSHTDTIHSAIQNDNKISFKYFHYSSAIGELKKNYSRNTNETTEWMVSPFALYWSDGNYYLYAYSESEDKFRYFRIDRMESIKELVVAKGREGKDEFSRKTLTTNREYRQFKMFRGKECVVSIMGKNSILDAFVDEFGKEVMYTPESNNQFRANVPVELSPTFYSWIASFGNKVKIIAPTEAVDGMKKFLADASSMYK